MRFKRDKIEEINNDYEQKCKDGKSDHICFKNVFKLRVENGINGATVYAGNWQICKVDELVDMLMELNILRDVIENKTGIVL